MQMRRDALNTHSFTYDTLDQLTSAQYSLLDTQDVTYYQISDKRNRNR
ncbi:MAG: hypothetical protein IKH26_12465 [Bacteroidaceae bacterium]|nr:hypothetical protein [Bacteroidaceae bacterium]